MSNSKKKILFLYGKIQKTRETSIKVCKDPKAVTPELNLYSQLQLSHNLIIFRPKSKLKILYRITIKAANLLYTEINTA